MTSIYQLALGGDFDRLHPRIRERFGFCSADGVASIGTGVMDRVWHNKWATLPLYAGASRHVLLPRSGKQIPFTVRNYAYVDGFGRETVTWCRQFRFPGKLRSFDATMIYSPARRRIVDYLGTKQHLAVDLDVAVSEDGGIRIRSGDQRFYEGRLGFRLPGPLTGIADVCERYDDRADLYRISVRVDNPIIGTVLRYDGRFQARTVPAEPGRIPLDVRPLREESRE